MATPSADELRAARLAETFLNVKPRAVPLSEIDSSELDKLSATLRASHRLAGAAQPSSIPLLGVEVAPSVIDLDGMSCLPYGWDVPLGGCLTLTLGAPVNGFVGTLFVGKHDAAFEQLWTANFRVVLYVRAKARRCLEFDFASVAEQYDHVYRVARDHQPVLYDREAAFWSAIRCRARSLTKILTAADWLSVGWSARYEKATRYLQHCCDQARVYGGLGVHFARGGFVGEAWPSLIRVLDESGFELDALSEHLRDIRDTGAPLELMLKHDDFVQCVASGLNGVVGDTYPPILHAALAVCGLSSQATLAGHRYPWLDARDDAARVKYLNLEPTRLPDGVRADEYWRRAHTPFEYCLGACVTGRDMPMDLTAESACWNEFPRVEDVEASEVAAEALFDEAISEKRWVIPPGAMVRLSAGPFAAFQFWEMAGTVLVVARNKADEFTLIAVEPDKKWFQVTAVSDGLPPEREDATIAGVKLLIAAIIRDFVVVEERERTFSHARQKKLPGQRTSPADEFRVIYLPRVRYAQVPNVARCRTELGQDAVRRHGVAAHLRKTDKASTHQLTLARRYGFTVPTGYTFVRPHQRGAASARIIYRSRSALQALYTETPAASSAPTRWFQFERDVMAFMVANGFEVQHVAAGRSGDHGIDVYATKGDDLDEVRWIIQCKCHAPKRSVGPEIVRELLGSLASYPHGTRGMIVTTSCFTSGAAKLAAEHNVKLIDGAEFLRRGG